MSKFLLVVLVGALISVTAMQVSGRAMLFAQEKYPKTLADGQNITVCFYFTGMSFKETNHYHFDQPSFDRFQCPDDSSAR